MAVKDYKTNPDENTTISGINIAEGCPPSGINNAIRQLMADAKQESENKSKEIASAPYLPLAGGAINGNLQFNRNGARNLMIEQNDQGFVIGTRPSDGWKSTIVFRNDSYSANPAGLEFFTGTNFDSPALFLQKNGSALWNGKNIVRSVNGTNADANGNVSINPMPVGSIYVQFAGQSAPADLFGGTWSNVSSSYAGRFFRAEGESAAAFGSTQAGGLPNASGGISGIGIRRIGNGSYSGAMTGHRVDSGGYSDTNFTGWDALSIELSKSNELFGRASEVRPINSTIRIWKRTA